jgi:hypothetical protein
MRTAMFVVAHNVLRGSAAAEQKRVQDLGF